MPALFYYPKINAPRSVIHQALLYWDRLVTVAPDGPLEQFLDHEMLQLHDAGLYTRLEAIAWPYVGRSNLERALRLLAHLRRRLPADELVPNGGPDNYIYVAKLSRAITAELKRRGLSRPVKDEEFVVEVSSATQLCLISAAARDIAVQYRKKVGGEKSLYAYTDSSAAHLFAHTPFAIDYEPPMPPDDPRPYYTGSSADTLHSESFEDTRAIPCFEVEIGSLLPVPESDVDVRDLIAFRERYDDERRRLMTAIDLLVHGVQRNYGYHQDVVRAVQRELEAALADVEHAGRAAGITWTRRSITATIALAASWAAQSELPKEQWILGVIAGVAINVATDSTRPSYHDSRGWGVSTEDVSYLQRVHRKLL